MTVRKRERDFKEKNLRKHAFVLKDRITKAFKRKALLQMLMHIFFVCFWLVKNLKHVLASLDVSNAFLKADLTDDVVIAILALFRLEQEHADSGVIGRHWLSLGLGGRTILEVTIDTHHLEDNFLEISQPTQS